VNVLFTCVIGHGHFHPMVPLARAFQAAGHEVTFATDPAFCAYVSGVGFEALPAGLDHREALARFVATTPGWDELPDADRMRHMYPGMFGRVRVPQMLEDLAGIIAARRPDLIIHESAEMAGALAAEVAGIAHAEHSFGLLRPGEVRRLATDAVAPYAAAAGVRNPGVGGLGGELYLDICPPDVQRAEIADVANIQPLMPVGFDSAPDANLPDWVAALPPRPTIYVTMGTVFNDSAEIFRTILAGLSEDRFNVVVTVGQKGDPGHLGPQPDHVHVERYIPQSLLLPHCDLFISHAGSGALLGALNAGVPMLAVPQGADQFMNAARIVETGLGLRLLPSDLSATNVRDSVRRLIGEGAFTQSARAQQAAIGGMPTPDAVVGVLETMVDRG
jgi:UDP:flavonoid glycosyltransferase YjiC (YdhE family)